MTSIFLSDVHLRDADSLKTRLVIRFLQEVASQHDRIYILGDLFDVWPGSSSYLISKFEPVLKTLKALVSEGHEVHYLEGNHDFKLGSYFTDTLGLRIYSESIEEVWNGKRIYMMHGDLGNPKERGYRVLRYLLRRDTLQLALSAVPPKWIFDVGLKSSKLSRQFQKKVPKSETAIRQIYRHTAEQVFKKGYDYVFMGHTHLPDDVTTLVDGRQCRYINIGDWVKHFTYLEFDGAQFYTRTHPVRDL